jgi:enediyne biosynthesis protein E4
MSPLYSRALGLAVAGLLSACSATPDPQDAPAAATTPAATKAAPSATVRFVDATALSGIDFVHTSGRSGRKYGVETIGSGAAFFDYNNDGWIDLYAVNSADLPGYTSPTTPRNALYRNDKGTFSDIATDLGVAHPGYGMGAVAGDYDNDGDSDLFVSNFGPNVLYRNEGAAGNWRFADVTAASPIGADTSWSTGCAFADYDNDGDLDLYVANYLDYGLEADAVGDDGHLQRPRRHLAPTEYPARRDFLYRNDGDGAFTDVTEDAGLLNLKCRELGAVFLDYDNDGDADLFQGNDATPNFLYRNNGDGTFTESGLAFGVAYNEAGRPEGTMGVDAADIDGDGFQDLVMTNFQWESNTLYRNEAGGLFRDVSREIGVGDSSFDRLAFGINFFDADNDGDTDLYVANGHIDEDIDRFDPQTRYAQTDQLYRNDGGTFTDISTAAGPGFALTHVGRGSAVADYDNDGDLDLFILNTHEKAVLLRNDTRPQGHWLALRLRGTASNRDGYGARVAVHLPGHVQWLESRSASSYLSQSDPRLFFGLDTCTVAERVVVHWPSGTVQELHDVDADQVVEITEKAASGIQAARTEPRSVPASPQSTAAAKDWQAFWRQAPLVLPAAVRQAGPQPERPLAQLQSAVDTAPQAAPTRLALAEGLRLLRRYEAAVFQYRRVLELDPTLAAAHTGLGQVLSDRGDIAAARQAFAQAAATDPQAAAPHYFTGNLSVRQGRFDAAIPHYERALARDSRYLQAYINLAGLYARQTDYGPAISVLERGIKALPLNAELAFQLGRIHFIQTRFTQALQQIRRVLELTPGRGDAFELLAQIHLGLDDAAAARRTLEEGLRHAPDRPELHARLGIILLEQDQTGPAIEHLQQALKDDPDHAEVYYNLGQAYTRLNRRAEGQVLLGLFNALQEHHQDLLDSKTAIVLNPNDAQAYYRLGAVYSRMGRYEAARHAYTAALHIAPRHLDSLNNLGNIYLRLRQLNEAIATYRQVLQIDPTYARAHNNLGNAYLLTGDEDAAMAAFEQAVQADSSYRSPRKTLVQLYKKRGLHAEAQKQEQSLKHLNQP